MLAVSPGSYVSHPRFSESIKEAIRKKFAKAANDFEQQLRLISSQISSMVGSLEVRLHSIPILHIE